MKTSTITTRTKNVILATGADEQTTRVLTAGWRGHSVYLKEFDVKAADLRQLL